MKIIVYSISCFIRYINLQLQK